MFMKNNIRIFSCLNLPFLICFVVSVGTPYLILLKYDRYVGLKYFLN